MGSPSRIRLAFLAVLLSASIARAYAVSIFSVSERAEPGETISINGYGFDATSQVLGRVIDDSGVAGSYQPFPISARNATYLQAQVPASMPGRLWQVMIQSATGSSTPAYINRARPYFLDSTDAAPNGLIRVFGRNMAAPGSVSETPMVRLRLYSVGAVPGVSPVKASSYLNATVIASSPYSLTFRVPPTVQPGSIYSVLVRNGPGGVAGEAEATQRMTGMVAHADDLGLGFNWATAIGFASNVYNVRTDDRLAVHASGNGVTNDSPAIRGAISVASQQGGGVVYLQAGTYQADDGVEIAIPSNVILKGDGPGQTVLHFGYRFNLLNPPPNENWWMAFDVGDLSGVMDMSLENQNTSLVPNQTIGRHTYAYPSAHRFFFSNVNFDLGNGACIFVNGTTNGVMQDCTITTQNRTPGYQASPILLSNIDQWIIRRNTLNYSISRLNFTASQRSVFEDNIVNRANQYNGIFESGGVETSFSQDIALQNNTIRGTGPPGLSTVDGELIMTQKSIIADIEDVGQVLSATSNSLSCDGGWPVNPIQLLVGQAPRLFVRIIRGKGVGQWRFVRHSTYSTVYVTQPWDVIPDATSSYSLGTFNNYQQLVLGNSLSNGSFGGVVWWDGACDSVCDSNLLVNTGRILLRCPDYAYTSTPGSTRRHCVGWNDEISNNTICNTNGIHMAQIEVCALNIGPTSYGNLIMGVDVRNNTVQSTWPIQLPDEMGNTEGIWNSVVFEGFYSASSPTDNIGSIYQGNNCMGAGVGFHDYKAAMTANLPAP